MPDLATDDVTVYQPPAPATDTGTGDDSGLLKPWLKFQAKQPAQTKPAPALPDFSGNAAGVARLPYGTNYTMNGGTYAAFHPTPPNAGVFPVPGSPADPATAQKPWEKFAKAKAGVAAPPPVATPKIQPTPYEQAQMLAGTRDPSQMLPERYAQLNPPTATELAAQQYGGLAPSTGWDTFKMKAENILDKAFPGYAEKASGNPFEVAGQSAMMLPVGMPERLAKPLMALFTLQTAAQQPELIDQIHDELKRGDYSAAGKQAVEDALQIAMVGSSLKAMKPEVPQPEPWQGPPVSGRQLATPPGAVPPPEPDLGPVPGVPTRGLPAGFHA